MHCILCSRVFLNFFDYLHVSWVKFHSLGLLMHCVLCIWVFVNFLWLLTCWFRLRDSLCGWSNLHIHYSWKEEFVHIYIDNTFFNFSTFLHSWILIADSGNVALFFFFLFLGSLFMLSLWVFHIGSELINSLYADSWNCIDNTSFSFSTSLHSWILIT